MLHLNRRLISALLGAGIIAGSWASVANAGSAFDAVKKKGTITVATEVAYPPMEFLKGGKVVGYGKDILDLIVADLGVKLEQLQLPWDGILAGVLAKKYDLVATSVAIKPDRVKKYAFTRPLAIANTMLVKRHGDDSMTALKDVNGKVIGVELGSSQAQEVEAVDAQLKKNGGTGFSAIRGFKSTDDMRLALAGRQVDIATIPSFSLATMQKQRPNTFAKLINIGNGTLFAWVVHPDAADLRDKVNEVLIRLKKDGTLAKLQNKWFGFEMELPEDYLPKGAL